MSVSLPLASGGTPGSSRSLNKRSGKRKWRVGSRKSLRGSAGDLKSRIKRQKRLNITSGSNQGGDTGDGGSQSSSSDRETGPGDVFIDLVVLHHPKRQRAREKNE